jgi:DNA-directed RNA polymerase beta' subunit
MKLDIMNIDKFIQVNELQEVTNPISFSRGNYPTEDGLFSYSIFGRPGSYDRKTIFAYIDLKDNFLHPLVYKNLIRLNRKIEECITGISYFTLDEEGNLVKTENEEEGKTGLSFLYNNWSKLNFKTTESTSRDERIDFLKALKRNEAFVNKWLVIPAFLRDANLSSSTTGKVGHDAINDKYAKLIRLAKALEENNSSGGVDFISNNTKGNVQKYLVEIFDYLIGLTKKKNGLFRQAVMGKSVDYGARSVISAPNMHTANTYKDMKVDMQHTGLPLAVTISVFNPFIIKWVEDFFKRTIGTANSILKRDKTTGKEVAVNLDKNVLDNFSYDKIKEKINLFIKAPSERFETIKVKLEDGTESILKYRGRAKAIGDDESHDSTIYTRNLTWTDIFYQAAIDVTADKYVYITRYPIEDYFGIYPCKATVLSTFKTAPQYIEGKYYEYYPVIEDNTPKEKVAGLFIDSTQIFNPMLNGLGGDYDG